ncbi:hypothetical protein YC2023_066793 [Brassica napus]
MVDYGIYGGEEFQRLRGDKPIFFLRLIFPVAGFEILSRTSGWYSFKLHLSILPFEYSRLEASLISAIIFLDRLSANLALFVNRQAPEVSLFTGVAVADLFYLERA